eukprot:10802462-Alexandrium_andersonii.AAC.1
MVKLMQFFTRDMESVIVWRFQCVLHKAALGVKDALTLFDAFLKHANTPFRYFTTLAKCVNVWRSSARE